MKALLPDEGNRGWVSRNRKASPQGLYPASQLSLIFAV